MLKKLIHQYFAAGVIAYFEGIHERILFKNTGQRIRDGLGFDVEGKKAVGAAHHDHENGEGFSLRNSQTLVIFYAFLSALALASALFMHEMSVHVNYYTGPWSLLYLP